MPQTEDFEVSRPALSAAGPAAGLELPMEPAPASRLSWMPTVALSICLTVLLLIWDPHVRDLAAQTFRTELFRHSGFAIWNGSWYGGHYTLTYSVLFPPLAALFGPRTVGALAVVLSAYLFDRLIRDHWGQRAHWATIWYGFGAVSLLAGGQLTFALGVAFGLLALRRLQHRHRISALGAAACCALASPVAAVFLAGVATVGSRSGDRGRMLAIGVGAIALALVASLNLAFPESGRFPFVFSSYVAIPLWCAGALYLARAMPGERRFGRVVLLYMLGATAAWLVPNPLGGNAIRLGALFGGPVLAAMLLSRRPRVSPIVVGIVLLGSLYWQMLGGVRAVAQSGDDPSTTAAYYRPVTNWLSAHGGHRVRIEVPPTSNHWEAAYLAPRFDLARGWLRQLDSTRDRIFYGDELSARDYRIWLDRNSVSYVAFPDAPPDYSATTERALIGRHPSFLRLRWSSPHWQVYQVMRSRPLIFGDGSSRAKLVSLGTQSFTARVLTPGWFTARVRFTPFWSVAEGAGCVSQAGHWTRFHANRPGLLRISISVSPEQAWGAISHAQANC